jgi:hypothetical protein
MASRTILNFGMVAVIAFVSNSTSQRGFFLSWKLESKSSTVANIFK